MMMRMLLVLIAVAGLTLGGCKKKEPTIGEKMDQMKQDAEKTADKTADEAKDIADDAQKTAEEAAK